MQGRLISCLVQFQACLVSQELLSWFWLSFNHVWFLKNRKLVSAFLFMLLGLFLEIKVTGISSLLLLMNISPPERLASNRRRRAIVSEATVWGEPWPSITCRFVRT